MAKKSVHQINVHVGWDLSLRLCVLVSRSSLATASLTPLCYRGSCLSTSRQPQVRRACTSVVSYSTRDTHAVAVRSWRASCCSLSKTWRYCCMASACGQRTTLATCGCHLPLLHILALVAADSWHYRPMRTNTGIDRASALHESRGPTLIASLLALCTSWYRFSPRVNTSPTLTHTAGVRQALLEHHQGSCRP